MDDIKGTNNTDDYRQAIKADIAILFNREDLVLRIVLTEELRRKMSEHEALTDFDQEFGAILMTHEICKDIQRGYIIWKCVNYYGIPQKRAKRIAEKEIRQ